jgi:hypothetical protein
MVSRRGYHNVPPEAIIFNKLLIAKLLFSDADKLISYLGNGPIVEKAKRVLSSKISEIEEKRELYKLKTTMTMDELAFRFNLNYRTDEEVKTITRESGIS